jgi:peptidyl-prolyl cis-trans isomerase A (cyclophilin A)
MRDAPRCTVGLTLAAGMAMACTDAPREQPEAAGDAPAAVAAPAPDTFRVAFETTKGPFVVEVIRAWSPRGADRFHELVNVGYFTDLAFFRVLPGFVAQFGMHGDPAVHKRWDERPIPDDPVRQTNSRGTLVFATAGPNTRRNQFFINYADNARLDPMGFSPIGRVVDGMDVVDAISAEYRDTPDQARIAREGNAYLKREFPRLDYITSARIAGAAAESVIP